MVYSKTSVNTSKMVIEHLRCAGPICGAFAKPFEAFKGVGGGAESREQDNDSPALLSGMGRPLIMFCGHEDWRQTGLPGPWRIQNTPNLKIPSDLRSLGITFSQMSLKVHTMVILCVSLVAPLDALGKGFLIGKLEGSLKGEFGTVGLRP